MISGMGRGKAAALRPVAYQHFNMIGHRRIVAGPQAEKRRDILDDTAAHEIGEDGRSDGKKYPPPAVAPVVDHGKKQQEQVERYPGG